MVLGFVLYEAVDLGYNVVKISYNSVAGLYNWYYEIDVHEKELEHKEKAAILEEMKKLNTRLKELENAIEHTAKHD